MRVTWRKLHVTLFCVLKYMLYLIGRGIENVLLNISNCK